MRLVDPTALASPEIERLVLATLLSHPHRAGDVVSALRAEHFTGDHRPVLFGLIAGMVRAGQAYDHATVQDAVFADTGRYDTGEWSMVNDAKSYSDEMLNSHVATLKRKARKRHNRATLTRALATIDSAGDDDAALAGAVQTLLAATATESDNGLVPIGRGLDEHLAEIDGRRHNKGGIIGLPTGFPKLNYLTSGFQPGQLIVVAGRPAMGKTALALNYALAVAHYRPQAGKVLFFSLEMVTKELRERLLSTIAAVPSDTLRSGHLSDEQWTAVLDAAKWLETSTIEVDQQPQADLATLAARARLAAVRGPVAMIVIDYLQLMKLEIRKGGNKAEALGEVSSGLKGLAKSLGVPIILLSQLNRDVENRDGNRPRASDLKGSGDIEQDADSIHFVHREHHYTKLPEHEGLAEIIVAKQRGGKEGTIDAEYQGDIFRFVERAADRVVVPIKPKTKNARGVL